MLANWIKLNFIFKLIDLEGQEEFFDPVGAKLHETYQRGFMKKQNPIGVFLGLTLALTSTANAGGVGGGGGGTLPIDPVTAEEVHSVAIEGSGLLRLIFKGIEARKPVAEPAIYQKLFGGEATIYDKIGQTGIYVATTTPCYDTDGNPNDGSIVAPEPNKICISSFSITQKLPESEAFPQIFALIVHEYSHLVGCTEAEADAIQLYAARALKKARVDTYRARQLRMGATFSLGMFDSVHYRVNELSNKLGELNPVKRGQYIVAITGQIDNFEQSALHQPPFAVFLDPQELVNIGFYIRARTISWKVRGATGADDADLWSNLYNKVFQNDPTIDAPTWRLRYMDDLDDGGINPPGFIMHRIQDDASLKVELDALASEMAYLKAFFTAVVSGK